MGNRQATTRPMRALLLAAILVSVPAAGTTLAGNDEAPWTLTQRLVAQDETKTWGQAGTSLAIDDDLAAVGAPDAQAVNLFERDQGIWVQTATLNPPGDAGGFARSVAIDANRGIVAVGAPWSSAVHVYQRAGEGWTHASTLHGSGALGVDLALSSGKLLAGSPDAGLAYVFKTDGEGWSQEARLSGPAGFGRSVTLDGDAERAAVGSIMESKAYVFEATSSGFTEETVLESQGSLFGYAVGLAADGSVLVVGEPGTSLLHVYEETGASWSHAEALAATDRASAGLDEGLGANAAVSASGETIVAGRWSSAFDEPGAAYVFTSDGNWQQEAQLLPPEPVPGENFGRTVAVVDDGSNVLVGAPGVGAPATPSLQPGAVYEFRPLADATTGVGAVP